MDNRRFTDFLILRGNNFSGRSAILKRISKFGRNDSNTTHQFLGPDITNFLSGLATTLEKELKVFRKNSRSDRSKIALEYFGIEDKINQNPYTLSGGEQTIVTILTVLQLEPTTLMIDCALEQLSDENRIKVINMLRDFPKLERVILSDNRINEYGHMFRFSEKMLESNELDLNIKPEHFRPYNSIAETLTASNITFGYPKELEIFKLFSISFATDKVNFLHGVNGSGKSTLSKLLCGVLSTKYGIFKHGSRVINPSANVSETCTFNHQDPDLQLFCSTVFEEISSSAKNKSKENIEMLISCFGLQKHKNSHPMDLPFVLRKRLSVAATFGMERPWIILDEPTLGQDDYNVEMLSKIIKFQQSNNTGIIIISHSKSFISMFDAWHVTL